MGYQSLLIKAPAAYLPEQLRSIISKNLGIDHFSWQMESKSLDARNKNNIHWVIKVGVFSDEIQGLHPEPAPILQIPHTKRAGHILVVGSGPAGFFAALVLQKAGFQVTLVERGSEVAKRKKALRVFEKGGSFDSDNNYAFGEGGAGTFSDGKLTARSKHITAERQFILSSYVKAGAPEEILYMAHPHLGTDHLYSMVGQLRKHLIELGGTILFDTTLLDIKVKDGRVREAVTSSGSHLIDAVFLAPGHSAYDTFRMLMRRGVLFRTKGFALGSRVEHPQELINKAQWGMPSLSGVKAAEYRLSSPGDGRHPVYTFCMCPGGMVVPATASDGCNVVNGMSYYNRGGKFANAACVAGVHPGEIIGENASANEVLDYMEQLESRFYQEVGGHSAPTCSVKDFLDGKLRMTRFESSHPLGNTPVPLWEMLPLHLVNAMRVGLKDFSRKMKGFESGILMGLESKTSAPIQVVREAGGRCAGFENLFLIGEGSGYAGGIISSGADGVKAAMHYVLSQ